MRVTPVLDRLYLANAAVLLVHQMDAAYWHEWRLFRMPGGLALYLVVNVPIALIVLAGYGAVAARRPSARAYSWALAGAGAFAAAFHAAYLASGDPAFREPVSLALLVDTALLSLAQAVLLVRSRRSGAGAAALAP
jgi:hypothetical protein